MSSQMNASHVSQQSHEDVVSPPADTDTHTDREEFRDMPKSVIDRLLSRKTRFSNLELTESAIDEILDSAAESGYDLDLSGAILDNDMPFFIIDSLSRNNYFQFAHVNLNCTHISSRGFDALVDSIVCFHELRTLTVRDNGLPKEAGMSLAKILGARANLQVLDARSNQLGDAGVAAISGAFTADLSDITPSTPISLLSLTVLDLSSNGMGDSGLLSLCRGLSHFGKSSKGIGRSSALQVLRLNHNKIGDKSAVCLAQFLESFYCTGHYAFEELSMSHNPIGHTGLVAILSAIQSASEKNATLMKLGLDDCKPNIEVLEEATKVLRKPTTSRLRILELSMREVEATEICNNDQFLDTIVSLSDAVAANDTIAILTLGELPDVTRKQVLSASPGSAKYYGLRVAMDCFRSMIEVLKMASHQQRQLLTSLENGQPLSVLKLQQQEFEKLRREHASVFHELSSEIRRLPLYESDPNTSLSTIQTSAEYTRGQFESEGGGVQGGSRGAGEQKSSTEGSFRGRDSPVRSRPSSSHYSPSRHSTLNTSMSTTHIGDIIKDAVSSALESAQRQWLQQLKNGSFSPDSGADSFQHRFAQLTAKVDVLQDQVLGLDAQAFNLADKSQFEEMHRLVIALESRISHLEARLGSTEQRQQELQHEVKEALSTSQPSSMASRLADLSERMSSLESMVEAEHETSLDLLEVLLKNNEKKHQRGHRTTA